VTATATTAVPYRRAAATNPSVRAVLMCAMVSRRRRRGRSSPG